MKNYLGYIALCILLFFAGVNISNNMLKVDDSGNCYINGKLRYDLVHLDAGFSGTYTPNVTQNVWFKLAPTITATENDGFTYAGDSITVITAGSYVVWFNSVISGATNDDYKIGIFKNGVLCRNDHRTTTGANNFSSGEVFCYIDGAVAGDDISFRVLNSTDSDDPTFSDMAVYIRCEYIAAQ